METLQVTYAGEPRSVVFGTTCAAWADERTAAVLVNGLLASVHRPLTSEARIVPVTFDDRLGHRVYRRTLAFLLELARRNCGVPILRLGPSWGGAHSYSAGDGGPLAEGQADALRLELDRLVAAALPLVPVRIPLENALSLLDPEADAPVRALLAQKNPPEVPFVRAGGALLWEPEVLLPSSAVPFWKLTGTASGLALEFPKKAWPLEPGRWAASPAVARAHADDAAWTRLQGVTTVADLNQLADRKESLEAFVQGAEAVHERKIAALGDLAAARKARVVLIAGPSSSGKTTFAKRLAVQLGAIGFRPLAVSLDDYFVNRAATPKDAEGRYDFECLEAMDRGRLAADLKILLAGGTAQLPVYDFKSGTRRPEGRPFTLGTEGVLILEGIHGLNRDLWPDRPDQGCLTVFVSALTSLTRDGRSRISTADHRLLRRLVRDRQFRGYSALQTLRQWPSVRRGEDTHLFPFQDAADAVFNSALPYELAVLREAALPLLEQVPPQEPEYAQARFLIDFLSAFHPLPVRLVPPFSLLREFVGQSGFHY